MNPSAYSKIAHNSQHSLTASSGWETGIRAPIP